MATVFRDAPPWRREQQGRIKHGFRARSFAYLEFSDDL